MGLHPDDFHIHRAQPSGEKIFLVFWGFLYIADGPIILNAMKTKLIDKLSDISRIHRRAAFTDVLKHTAPKPSEFLNLAGKRYSCRGFDGRPVPDNLVADRLDSAGYSLALQMENDASVCLEAAATAMAGTTAASPRSTAEV